MEFGGIIIAVCVATGAGMFIYSATNHRRYSSRPTPRQMPQPNHNEHNLPNPKPATKSLPPEFTENEITSVLTLITKIDNVYKKM